eukprot:TRINITY_DN4183_c0_g1_i1.p1 TRINITY_DN4183_c0_g1~~TRINITY_DN4183_c0_g1_i1.p1  ORF type:complete len:651 (+),score=147.64 TRINITY_DN4183_c0_g1_i1:51-2003(+)
MLSTDAPSAINQPLISSPSVQSSSSSSASLFPSSSSSSLSHPTFPSATDTALPKSKVFVQETYVLIRYSAAVMLANLLWYSIPVVLTIYVGHLSESEKYISSIALANMFVNVTGMSLGYGFASGIDTLGGQAFGSKKYKVVAYVLQRTILIITLLIIPICVLWYFSEDVLVLCGQNAETSKMAAHFIRISCFGIWPNCIYNALISYLQCQGIMMAEVYAGIGVNIENAFVGWLMIIKLGFGFEGAAWTSVVSAWCSLGTVIFIIYIKGYYLPTWTEWSRKALTGWWKLLKVAVPGMGMMASEWWIFEIMALFAGHFGEQQLAGYGIIWQIYLLLYMVPLGVGISVATRVSNLLGSGEADRARVSSWAAIVFAQGWQLMLCLALYICRHSVGYIFSNDSDLVHYVSTLVGLLCIGLFFDGLQSVLGGIIRGMGRQDLGVIVGVIGYYLIGLPTSLIFGYKVKLEVHGLWWGLDLALVLSSLCCLIIILVANWQKESERAIARANDSPPTTPNNHPMDNDCADASSRLKDNNEDDDDEEEEEKARHSLSSSMPSPTVLVASSSVFSKISDSPSSMNSASDAFSSSSSALNEKNTHISTHLSTDISSSSSLGHDLCILTSMLKDMQERDKQKNLNTISTSTLTAESEHTQKKP